MWPPSIGMRNTPPAPASSNDVPSRDQRRSSTTPFAVGSDRLATPVPGRVGSRKMRVRPPRSETYASPRPSGDSARWTARSSYTCSSLVDRRLPRGGATPSPPGPRHHGHHHRERGQHHAECGPVVPPRPRPSLGRRRRRVHRRTVEAYQREGIAESYEVREAILGQLLKAAINDAR